MERMWPGRGNSRGRRKTAILVCLVLACCFLSVSCEQGTPAEWDELSHLIPTNSVYEQREKNASSPESSPAGSQHSPRENKIPREQIERESEPEDPEEVYEDEYESETDARGEPEDAKLSEIREDKTKQERATGGALSATNEEEETSRDEDYLEDPSTKQYDTYYYYYDDYENGNRSRYEAVEEADTLDYPDTEEEPEEGKEEGRANEKENLQVEPHTSEEPIEEHDEESTVSELKDTETSEETSDLEDEKEVDDSDSTTNFEEASSMEGSAKTFRILGPPGKSGSDADSSILIGEAIVSVVTTKSVVNGTISVPTTPEPRTTEQMMPPPSSSSTENPETTEEPLLQVTTEDSSRILASVQTSRSISGARFLPFPVIDRVEPIDGASLEKKTSQPPESTESIIDKLDRVQSELSSGFLVGGFRRAGNTLQLDVINERDRGNRRRFTTTAKTPVISKFVPRRYNDKKQEQTTTSAKPRAETTFDHLEGLLPKDYVPRYTTTSTPGTSKTGFRWPSSKSTTTSEIPETKSTATTSTPVRKPKPVGVVQDINAFLPAGYKLKKEDSSVTESSLLSDILAKSKVDISSLLPADYNKKDDQTTPRVSKSEPSTTTKAADVTTEKPVEKSLQDLFAKSSIDISSLLPSGYEEKRKNITPVTKATESPVQSSTVQADTPEVSSTTTKKPGGIKLVFPSRPGGRKTVHKITTPHPPHGDAPGAVTLKIQKGWPTRATTEFTGWPTPSTTPISIEKLLEAARTATVAPANSSLIPTTNIVPSTSTTSTTTTTVRPTTPGICENDCEVAGTIRIIGNATWVPELLDRNTYEWQQLANEVEREMNFIFSKSAVLTHWYKKIRIDSFSQGSILVDYFVELADLQQIVNTQELKVIFHDSLKTYNAFRNETDTKGSIKLGRFIIDPKYTDFVVIPKVTTPQYMEKDDRLIPQWAIAVIVIGIGGLLFIIIFGVSVLINRQHGSKLKPTVSTIYDEEIVKNLSSHRSSDYSKPVHTIWTDPDVSWNDKSFESTSNKVLVEKPFQDNKKYNLYDSWRSEWNGYNYYNTSHGSSKYGGYDTTTNLSSRHHPDYDTNF